MTPGMRLNVGFTRSTGRLKYRKRVEWYRPPKATVSVPDRQNKSLHKRNLCSE